MSGKKISVLIQLLPSNTTYKYVISISNSIYALKNVKYFIDNLA